MAAEAVPLLDTEGQVPEPLLLVDLDVDLDRATVARTAASLARSDRVVVGVSASGSAARSADERAAGADHAGLLALLEACDVSVVQAVAPGSEAPSTMAARGTQPGHATYVSTHDITAALDLLEARVRANPQASLALTQLLRTGACLGAEEAVVLESYTYSTLLGGAEFAAWLAAQGSWSAPPMVTEAVLLDRVATETGNELRIRLNRPERRNAYGRQVRDELVAALDLALLDPTITTVVLDGAGPCFSAGGDLGEFGTTPDPVLAHRVRTSGGAGRRLARLADRVMVHVHGTCVGAGVELPAFAGRVVAEPGTTFRLPEVGMGLVPGAGGTASLPRRIRRWRTAWLGLTGASIDATTALAWGLVDEVQVPDAM